MTTKTDIQDLASKVSEWSQREVECKILPETVDQLLHTPENMSIWEYISKSVKSTTPLDVLLSTLNKVAKPPPPEVVSRHKRMCQEENDLDFEIANLGRDLESHLEIMEQNNNNTYNLKREVYMQSSKIELIKSFQFLLGKDCQINEELITQTETALSDLPCSEVSTWNNSELSSNIEEAVDMLRVYYQKTKSDNPPGEIRKIHQKLKQMIKWHKSEDYLEILSHKVETQKLQLLEGYSDLCMIKHEMDKCLSELQAAHRKSFFNVQQIANRIRDLGSEKALLVNRFKQHITSLSDSSHLEKMYDAIMKNILGSEMIQHMLEPKVPDGMPSLSIQDLEEAQHQIEVKEVVFKNISVQITKVRHANQSMLPKICTSVLADNHCDSDTFTDEFKHLQVFLKSHDVSKNLDEVHELLHKLITQKQDLNDLCVRTNSQLMDHSVKAKLQKALGLSTYESPEFLVTHLKRKKDEFWDNCGNNRVQSGLINKLDSEKLVSKFYNILRSIETSNLNAVDVAKKADNLTDYASSLLSCKELEECLQDFKTQPAFDDDVLSTIC